MKITLFKWGLNLYSMCNMNWGRKIGKHYSFLFFCWNLVGQQLMCRLSWRKEFLKGFISKHFNTEAEQWARDTSSIPMLWASGNTESRGNVACLKMLEDSTQTSRGIPLFHDLWHWSTFVWDMKKTNILPALFVLLSIWKIWREEKAGCAVKGIQWLLPSKLQFLHSTTINSIQRTTQTILSNHLCRCCV